MSDKTGDRDDAGKRTQTAQAVRDLWSEIKKSKRVVIFCGAGVTIGRTGVSWGDLVRQVGRKTLCTEEDQSSFCEACDNFFGSTSFTPEQKASVAAAKLQDDTTINEVIKETLYNNSGYQEGRLLDALTNFIMEMLVADKEIDIVTTNYDTHIEDRMQHLIEAYKNNGEKELPKEKCPRMTVTILKDDGPEENEQMYDGGGSTVNFVYVHGRVDSYGKARGTVVFSERDYEKSHDRTTEKLMKLFKDSPTIIVGSSLADTPLIRSLLGVAREESKGGRVHYHRYAVMAGVVVEDNEASTELQVLRAKQLGLKPLFYDYYDEIADIFWNLRAFLLKGVDDFEEDLPCELAKNDWVKKAEKQSRERTISTQVYEYSARFARGIRNIFGVEDEYLKIEFWFLEGDDGQTHKRFLKVWTNSAGPVYTRGLRRCEEITRANAERVASMRSFVDGRANLKPLDELNIGVAFTSDLDHPFRQVAGSHLRPRFREHRARGSGSCGHVEDLLAWQGRNCIAEGLHPHAVHPAGHDEVHEVVAFGHVVEHGGDLTGRLGQICTQDRGIGWHHGSIIPRLALDLRMAKKLRRVGGCSRA